MPQLTLVKSSAGIATLQDISNRFVYIPTSHLDLVLSRNWRFVNGYYQTEYVNMTIGLHECILGVKTNPDLVVDHWDGDPSNNLVDNLQVVSNAFNILKRRKTNSLPLGVKPQGNSFESKIWLGENRISFGHTDVEYLANLVYTVYTQSGLATHEQFMAHRPEPYKVIQEAATEAHQTKLQLLIEGLSERVKKFRQVRPLPLKLTP